MKYLILMLMFMGTAQAWDGEIGIGESKFTARPDGVWYQQPFPHELNMISKSGSIGITGMIFDDLRFRVGYKYLGQVSSNALAVGNDAIYSAYGVNAPKHMALSQWIGKGQVNMLYATISPEYKWRDWTFYTETGLTLYRPTWDMRVFNYMSAPNAPVTSMDIKANSTIALGGTIGAGVKYKDWDVVVNAYDIRINNTPYPALYHNLTTSLTLRHTF